MESTQGSVAEGDAIHWLEAAGSVLGLTGTEAGLLLVAGLLAGCLGLQLLTLRRARHDPAEALAARLDALHQGQLRSDQLVREELARGRGELAEQTRHLREEIPRTFAFGVAMFPLLRELILTATIWLLILPRCVSKSRAAVIAILLIAALFALRWGGWPTRYGWLTTGLVLLALAVMMAVKSRRRFDRERSGVEEFTIDPHKSPDITT